MLTMGRRILYPWRNTWLWNTLRVLIPPAPLRLLVLDTYEPETTHLFRQLLRPGMTVVDMGAFIGHYTILSAMEVGNSGHVFAFEPDLRILPKLEHNVRLSGCEDRVTIIPAAVSNKTGEGQLFSGKEGWLTIYPRAVDHMSAPIEVISLDAYFGNLGWPTVNLMKMDIDGAEIWALEGMVELSRRNPHLKLVMKFAPYHIREAGGTPERFFETLQKVGFNRFFAISKELRRLVIPRDLGWLVEKAERMTVNLLCKRNVS
jgi:FkbM family methyltransferase